MHEIENMIKKLPDVSIISSLSTNSIYISYFDKNQNYKQIRISDHDKPFGIDKNEITHLFD
jgi:low temperature requirement protein LtrA